MFQCFYTTTTTANACRAHLNESHHSFKDNSNISFSSFPPFHFEMNFCPKQLMRRSMKKLKTFKQMRRGDSIPNDPNSIALEEINGKNIHKLFSVLHFCSVSHSHLIVIAPPFICFVFVNFVFTFYLIFVCCCCVVCVLKTKNLKGDGIVSTEEEVQPTIGEHIAFAIGNISDVVCKHSYVISNITMMVSSMAANSMGAASDLVFLFFSIDRRGVLCTTVG